MTKKCLYLQVFGLVQGVWFRRSTMEKAIELGLSGIVRNEKDGSVYIEAEGAEDNLKIFSEWCKKGPSGAKVIKLIEEEIPFKKYSAFTIKK